MIDLGQDLHVHSSEYSRDAFSTITENIRAAEVIGLNTLGLADHVRSDSMWLPQKREQLLTLGNSADIEILFGIEAKILNRAGDIDAPKKIVGVDYILIADHRFPSENGPLEPSIVRQMIHEGEMTATAAISCIIDAMINSLSAVARLPYPPILAHPFSLLPKLGLSERMISTEQLERLGEVLISKGALLEINEKWNCPSSHVALYMSSNGVALVAGSDAHVAAEVGVYSQVREIESESVGADGR